MESAIEPAKKDVKDAGIRIDETRRPWTVEEKDPNSLVNWVMVVMGPIHPVSNPKMRPPKDTRIHARMYGCGRGMVRMMGGLVGSCTEGQDRGSEGSKTTFSPQYLCLWGATDTDYILKPRVRFFDTP